MTTSTHPADVKDSSKPSRLVGCILTIFVVLFGMLGVFDLVCSSVFAYVFFSIPMLSVASIATISIIFCHCAVYLFLAFRLKRQRWFVTVALLAVVWLVLPVLLRLSINTATMRLHIEGVSMEPALLNGEYILADRQAYQQHLPQRGDVVVMKLPPSFNSNAMLIKRVIGLPGETVKINEGQVFINNVLLDEPYISSPATYSGEWKIPEGQYFVLGDNRNNSRDSHQWGLLPREYILAKVVWIYWPPASFGKVSDINFAP